MDRDYRNSIPIDGRQRSYRLHLPKHSRDGMPLWIALHGTGIDGDRMATFCGLSELADKYEFAVVYPDGTGRSSTSLSWNVGYRTSYASRQEINDVEFMRVLIDHLAREYAFDRRHVYATGVSSGGMLCYCLAQQIPTLITAIGPVAGTLPDSKPIGIGRDRPPLPVIHFHGTEDAYVPFQGGVGARSLSRIDFRSVRESIDWSIERNRCEGRPTLETIESDDETRVVRESYANAKGVERVVLYTIEGGGHTWPGRIWPEEPTNPNTLGYTTHAISANEELWRFFQRFENECL